MIIKTNSNILEAHLVWSGNQERADKKAYSFPFFEAARLQQIRDRNIINQFDEPLSFPIDQLTFSDTEVIFETDISHLPFDQSQLNGDQSEGLKRIQLRYNGLCDLICNKVLIEDLLGKGTETDFLSNAITLSEIDKPALISSHILHVYSFVHRFIAFLFGLYPDNILSFIDQKKLIVTKHGYAPSINPEILEKGLKKIEDGESLKIEVFNKNKLSFQGHSLLVKKISDSEYIFFDPNEGEFRGLSFHGLIEKLNDQLSIQSGTGICFISGKSFKSRLINKKIIIAANQSEIRSN